jgi:hypothetical protein
MGAGLGMTHFGRSKGVKQDYFLSYFPKELVRGKVDS